MNEAVRRAFMAAKAMLTRRTKALGLRVVHRCQRHEDGSYTILIRLLPEGVGVDVGGIDGVVFFESQEFFKANRRQNTTAPGGAREVTG